jgi:hypothetical protein
MSRFMNFGKTFIFARRAGHRPLFLKGRIGVLPVVSGATLEYTPCEPLQRLNAGLGRRGDKPSFSRARVLLYCPRPTIGSDQWAVDTWEDDTVAAQGNVPHDDYRSGFIAGFQALAGTSRAIPATPAQPATRAGMTPSLMGVRKGIQRAGGSFERE